MPELPDDKRARFQKEYQLPVYDADVLTAIADADAAYGRISPEALKAAKKLRWLQSPQAAVELTRFGRRGSST